MLIAARGSKDFTCCLRAIASLCCEERLGMGPIRCLSLWRMHLVRQALTAASPNKTTVAHQVGTEYGFWELGRFAAAYRELFGESPSASLGIRAIDPRIFETEPSAWAIDRPMKRSLPN